jgi:hypothetical protein
MSGKVWTWFHKCTHRTVCKKHMREHQHVKDASICFDGWRRATGREIELQTECSMCYRELWHREASNER